MLEITQEWIESTVYKENMHSFLKEHNLIGMESMKVIDEILKNNEYDYHKYDYAACILIAKMKKEEALNYCIYIARTLARLSPSNKKCINNCIKAASSVLIQDNKINKAFADEASVDIYPFINSIDSGYASNAAYCCSKAAALYDDIKQVKSYTEIAFSVVKFVSKGYSFSEKSIITHGHDMYLRACNI